MRTLNQIAKEYALDLLNACKGREEYQENEDEELSGLDKYFAEILDLYGYARLKMPNL